jgi:hypothetical protein
VTVDQRGRRIPPNFRIGRFQHCSECHDDAHSGQFARRSDRGACETCHSVEGYLPVRFGVPEHADSRFALTGSHRAVPCARCHPANVVKSKSPRQFVWKAELTCASCHQDVHGGQFRPSRFPGCTSCHTPETWTALRFSHDDTAFPLTGKHIGVACLRCHMRTTTVGTETVRTYAGAPTRCVECHPQSEVSMLKARMN